MVNISIVGIETEYLLQNDTTRRYCGTAPPLFTSFPNVGQKISPPVCAKINSPMLSRDDIPWRETSSHPISLDGESMPDDHHLEQQGRLFQGDAVMVELHPNEIAYSVVCH